MADRVHVHADQTLHDDSSFWSSRGSPHMDSQDELLYQLKGPLCSVRAVAVAIYRADFQIGCATAAAEWSFWGATVGLLHTCAAEGLSGSARTGAGWSLRPGRPHGWSVECAMPVPHDVGAYRGNASLSSGA